MSLADDAKATVAATFARASRTLDYLDKIPCLFARVGQPGVAQRCIEQFDSVDEREHDIISLEFCSPTRVGSMRTDMLAVDYDGSNVSARLQREVLKNGTTLPHTP